MTDLSPWELLGLPVHPLIIHATVVVLPATALLLVLAAFSARVRARAGVVLPLLALASVVLVPLSTSSGESLEHALPRNPAIAAHAAAGDALLPWALGLLVASVVVWASGIGRNPLRGQRPRHAVNPLSFLAAVLAVTVAVGTTVQVVYIGHLGAAAAWAGIGAAAG